MRAGERDYDFDRRAQIAVIFPPERLEVVQIVKVYPVVYQHRVVDRFLIEIEALQR